ncbi:MAG: hypothetical protein HY518_01875 [Candidatus Aenigmarchaeota archaeon]|nr:hypothetical protein [Candidatus Aenigmarchaeota archaeon]
MPTNAQDSIIDRLANHDVRTLDVFEVARELTGLKERRDAEGVRKLRETYLVGVGRLYPVRNIDEVRGIVDGNLLFAAGIADIVKGCGYEASGQLLVTPRHDGPVAKFFQEAIGYHSASKRRK